MKYCGDEEYEQVCRHNYYYYSGGLRRYAMDITFKKNYNLPLRVCVHGLWPCKMRQGIHKKENCNYEKLSVCEQLRRAEES